MDDTPRSLLQRLACNADEPDWRRLVDLYRPFIAMWLNRASVPTADADDLTQDVLVVVVKEIPSFHHSDNRGAFRKWLRLVVVHRTQNYWRTKLSAPRQAPGVEVLDALEDPASGLSGEWDREYDAHVTRRLLAAIECEFAPTTWAAFRRQVADGAKAADVALELGITVNAALIAKSRVLRRLRDEAKGLIETE